MTISCNMVVEIKGYRREDAKEKKSTMETYWVPGVNNSGRTVGGHLWSLQRFTGSKAISKPKLKSRLMASSRALP